MLRSVRPRPVTSRSSNSTRPSRRPQQARDDVEQRGLAAARGAEQRVGAAVAPFEVDAASAPSRRRPRAVGAVAVAQVARGGSLAMRTLRRASASSRRRRSTGSARRRAQKRRVSPTVDGVHAVRLRHPGAAGRASKWITLSEPLISVISTLACHRHAAAAARAGARGAGAGRGCSVPSGSAAQRRRRGPAHAFAEHDAARRAWSTGATLIGGSENTCAVVRSAGWR